MKKLIVFILMIIILESVLAGTALAGGWFKSSTTDTVGSGYWKDQDDNSGIDTPHGGFSTTSNLCKTCHAVHLAGDSYRLLKSGNTTEGRSQGEIQITGMGNRHATECMYCHDADSGTSDLKAYGMIATTIRE